MIKANDFRGFEAIGLSLQEANEAYARLSAPLPSIVVNAVDPNSIENGINEMERIIDERAGSAAGNPFIKTGLVELKKQFRKAVAEHSFEVRHDKGDNMLYLNTIINITS